MQRARGEASPGVRQFCPPKMNFNAHTLSSLINWQEEGRFEPPCLRNITDDELEQFVESGDSPTVPNFPCHTQAVERSIKLVTEASCTVAGEENRDSFIKVRLQSYKEMPVFSSKKDFVL